jgi:hypothetical protein
LKRLSIGRDKKGKQKEILKIAKQGDINTFTVIKSDKNHHAIIECSEILGHHYYIKCELFRILEETIASNQRNYSTCQEL